MTINDLSSFLIIYAKKVLAWIANANKRKENSIVTHKQNTNLTDNSVKNNITFNECNFSSPPEKIIASINKTKVLEN